MSSATKVTIATVVLLAAVVGVYYGFRRGAPETAHVEDGRPHDVGAFGAEYDGAGILNEAVAERLPSPSGRGAGGEGIPTGGAGAHEVPSGVLARDRSDLGTRTGVVATGELEPSPFGVVTMGRPPQSAIGTGIEREIEGPPAPGPPRYVDYTVKPDDTMWTIAQQWLGDADRWVAIARANAAINPHRLRVGQRLRLPPVRGSVPAALPPRERTDPTTARRAADRRATLHTVRSGDTLTGIAERYYRQADNWRLIYEHNRATIGRNPNRLKVGTRLQIPER